MKVTIIIPIYKVERYIISCLDSVLHQTHPDLECVLVNDDTPDQSFILAVEHLKNYNGSIEFKYVNHDSNQGLSAQGIQV